MNHYDPAGQQPDWKYFLYTRKTVPMNTLMITLNILAFLAVEVTGPSEDAGHMIASGAAFTPLVAAGEYYRLFTAMFLHFGLSHLINNMLVLVFLGDMLERAAGRIRYLLIYMLGGLGAGWFSFFLSLTRGEAVVSAGASGAVFAVMGAVIYIILINRGRLEDMTTKKILFMAALSLYFGITSIGVDNAAHLSGIVLGFFLGVLLYRRS